MSELLVVGSGPGGVAAAVQAAQLGARVTLVERSALGGTCVHAGCIPAAGYRRAAAAREEIASSGRFGVVTGPPRLEWDRVQAWVGSVVEEAASQVRAALTIAGVEVLTASARFVEAGVVQAGRRTFRGLPIVVATGARSRAAGSALTSEGAMALTEVPAAILVAGGGRFSIEWADLFISLGARVTVTTQDLRVLTDHDVDIASYLQVLLEEKGVEFRLGAAAEVTAGGSVLAADGRVPNVEGLGLELAGILLAEHGGIAVDECCRTSAAQVFAAGDVTGPPWLSNRARAMGAVAARTALGDTRRLRPERIPRSVNTRPELAAVGLTEEEALRLGRQVAVGYGEFAGNLRALAMGEARGALKLVVDSEYGEILGTHVVGVGAGEVIAQVVTAMELEADYRELAQVHHLHPSLAEVVAAAAASCEPSTGLAAG